MASIVIASELENLRRITDQHLEKGHQFEWGEGVGVVTKLLFGVIQVVDLALALEFTTDEPINFDWTEKGFKVNGVDGSCFELNMSSRENAGEFTIVYSAKDIEKIEYHLFMNPREILQSTTSALGEVCGINEVSKEGSRGVLARNMFSFMGAPTTGNKETLPERFKKMLVYSS